MFLFFEDDSSTLAVNASMKILYKDKKKEIQISTKHNWERDDAWSGPFLAVTRTLVDVSIKFFAEWHSMLTRK